MLKKIAGVILILLVFSIMMLGCQQTAQKPYTNDNNNNQTNTMTENERRVLAERLSNLAEEVDGVKKASVIVSSMDITQDTNITVPDGNTANNNVTNSTDATDTGLNTNMRPNTTDRITNPGATSMNTPNTNTGNRVNTNVNNVNGLMVMVGLTLDNNIMNDTAKIKTIKQTVANRMQAADARISQVLVTSDPDLMKRINNVASGLLNGKPVKSFENDIKNLGRDLQREMPAF
ncbi:MAG TPA: YhcN/YlaJ family sporulation lipoprotein [Syntrophomonadaceae bacterium]|jgi:hypothetical protein|nr:YhcN/YlaJ family sporulation lipoprotein [Syntrophomonadaceae bacterium]HRX20263.1 YhcN/YlaJ family sporulation lipoprotein [Syntrophomonadaceae bacterium]